MELTHGAVIGNGKLDGYVYGMLATEGLKGISSIRRLDTRRTHDQNQVKVGDCSFAKFSSQRIRCKSKNRQVKCYTILQLLTTEILDMA